MWEFFTRCFGWAAFPLFPKIPYLKRFSPRSDGTRVWHTACTTRKHPRMLRSFRRVFGQIIPGKRILK
jgi:hypothetical protein